MSTNGPTRLTRLRRVAAPANLDGVTDVQAELALLREENRRLAAQAAAPPDLARLIARARGVRSAPVERDALDEAAALLAEDLALREGLVEICRELIRFLTEIETRLARRDGDA